MLVEFSFLAFLAPTMISGFGRTVRIGGLFQEDSLAQKAFLISVASLNNDKRGAGYVPRFVIQAESVRRVENDSYDVSRTVCDLGNKGVAAIFGPHNEITSRIVQSMCDDMEIPRIAARWDSRRIRRDGLINVYPYSQTLSTVYLKLAEIYEWKRFTIIYENEESLVRMKLLLGRWDAEGHTVTLRQLPEGPDYRRIFNKVKSSGDKNVVLDCSVDILPEIMKQMQQVGIMTDEHNYIVASLDLQTIDFEPYKYGGTSITGLRMMDPEDPVVIEAFERAGFDWGSDDPSKLTVEAALVYDGVQLFGKALSQLDDTIIADVRTSLCNNLDSWEHGSSLLNLMRSTEIRGLTGLVKFDSIGLRSDFELDVISLGVEGVRKIGVWNSSRGIELIRNGGSGESQTPLIRDQSFIILICLTDPYGMLKQSATTKTGNDRYEGFGIDIVEQLSKTLGFNYTLREHDPVYGFKDKETGEWNGMIREIMEDRADLAVTDLTITADREEAVDFTLPFMNLGIGILFTKPRPTGSKLFSFLMPFSTGVWNCLISSYVLFSLLLFAIARICPGEWHNPYCCVRDAESFENRFNFRNSFWFALGSFMRQGSDLFATGLSTRILTISWSLFCFIMYSFYTANLTVFLLIVTHEVLIKSAEDLAANAHGIKYGAKRSGSTIDFFKTSRHPVYSKIYEYMLDNEDEVLVEENEEGVQKVLQGKFAYFMESSTIDYEVERRCSLAQVGSLLDFKGYGIAMKKHSPYRKEFNAAILKLHEFGILKDLERKWWSQKRGGGKCAVKESTPKADPLGTDNVGGVFLVLVVGTSFSCFYTFFELVWEVRCSSVKKNVSYKNQMRREILFVVDCNATTKPAKRRREKNISRSERNQDEDRV